MGKYIENLIRALRALNWKQVNHVSSLGPEGSSGLISSKLKFINLGCRTYRDGGRIMLSGSIITLVAESLLSDFRIQFASYGKDGPPGAPLPTIWIWSNCEKKIGRQ